MIKFKDSPWDVVWSETSVIKCPECGTIQQAEAVQYRYDMWPSYVHTCVLCDYIILESEWEGVDDA